VNAAAGAVVERPAAPPIPETLASTGLTAEFLVELLLRALHVQGARTGHELAELILLPFTILDDQLLDLQQRRLVEVRGTAGSGRAGYTFDVTQAGRERAKEALEQTQYVGPAPVPLAQYVAWAERESVRSVRLTRARIRAGFPGLVLDEHLFELLGPAVNSGRSIFLHGEPGNGKTVIAEAIARLLGVEPIHIPYAVLVDGQVMILFDPVHHRVVEDEAADGAAAGALAGAGLGGSFAAAGPAAPAALAGLLRREAARDRRFVRVRRPVVVTGGELTLDQLDLQFEAQHRLYRAPFQLRANGGVLIIDDFGRQRVPASHLLNRWIVPLERRIDYLTMHTGVKLPVPFDCLVIFATNLDPAALVDEAFLRRIRYKIRVPGPSREAYEAIFRQVCAERGVAYEPAAVAYIYAHYYDARGIPPRNCHPRDLVDHVLDFARYREREPRLEPALLAEACESYFLIMNDGLAASAAPAGEAR
jgi:predicted ATPase with chaperone activity